MRDLFTLKETEFNEIEGNATDCKGCPNLTEDSCEGAADDCIRIEAWFEALCNEHEGNGGVFVMTGEQKEAMLRLINGLPDYRDPAWNDDLDGCKLDVDFSKRKLLELLQPSNSLHALWIKNSE